MIQITPQMRIWVALEPVDFRKGIDGLAGLCRQQLQADPMDEALFVFCSRNPRPIHSASVLDIGQLRFGSVRTITRKPLKFGSRDALATKSPAESPGSKPLRGTQLTR